MKDLTQFALFISDHAGLLTTMLLIIIIGGAALINKVLTQLQFHLTPAERKLIEYIATGMLLLHCGKILADEEKGFIQEIVGFLV